MPALLDPPPIQSPLNQGSSMRPPVPNDVGLFSGPWIRWFNDVYVKITSGSGGGGSSASYVDEISLTADTLITSPVASPNEGDILTLFITEDSTGGWQITYDPGPPEFKLVTVNDIDSTANMVNVQQFVCRSDGNWWLTGLIPGRLE
jgi:hypothetical protein